MYRHTGMYYPDMNRKKVLIITYYWPPASGPGVFRFLKISRYLREFGWEPVILTVKNGSYPAIDPALQKNIPEGIKVYKTLTVEPFALFNLLTGKKGKALPVAMIPDKRHDGLLKRLLFYIRANFFIPDARKGWIFFARRKALRIIRDEQIEAIITTGPPHSTHLIGLTLKTHCRLPWIADLRDPWVNIYYNSMFPRSAKTQKKDQLLEDKVISTADMVTVVSHGMKKEFGNRAKKIDIIFNGFDDIDIVEKKMEVTEKFILAYVGNFKPQQNIPMLWQAIAELKETTPRFEKLFTLTLTGNVDVSVQKTIKRYGLEALVRCLPFVSHHEAVKYMVDANALLFVISNIVNNEYIITGKLFEYLASRTPVLSIGPPGGDASAILQEAGRDAMCGYDEKEKFKQRLMQHFNWWLENDQQCKIEKESNILQYSRKKLTEKLSMHLYDLCNQ